VHIRHNIEGLIEPRRVKLFGTTCAYYFHTLYVYGPCTGAHVVSHITPNCDESSAQRQPQLRLALQTKHARSITSRPHDVRPNCTQYQAERGKAAESATSCTCPACLLCWRLVITSHAGTAFSVSPVRPSPTPTERSWSGVRRGTFGGRSVVRAPSRRHLGCHQRQPTAAPSPSSWERKPAHLPPGWRRARPTRAAAASRSP